LVCGCPVYLRSDNGFQFTAEAIKWFLKELSVNTPLFVEPGSLQENGYVESFNNRMPDELLKGELFLHIDEMKYVVERWWMDYNHYQSLSSLSHMTPAGFSELRRETGGIRPYTPVLDGVQDCGILSQTLDPKKGQVKGMRNSGYPDSRLYIPQPAASYIPCIGKEEHESTSCDCLHPDRSD